MPLVPRDLNSITYKRLRRALATARSEAGLTQQDLASKLDRPQSFVSKFEGGERHLDVVEFVQVCKAIGISPSAVLSEIVG